MRPGPHLAPAGLVVLVALGIVLAHNVGTLRAYAIGTVGLVNEAKVDMLAGVWLARTGEPLLETHVERTHSPNLSVAMARRWSTRACSTVPAPDADAQLRARLRLQVVGLADARRHRRASPSSAAGAPTAPCPTSPAA